MKPYSEKLRDRRRIERKFQPFSSSSSPTSSSTAKDRSCSRRYRSVRNHSKANTMERWQLLTLPRLREPHNRRIVRETTRRILAHRRYHYRSKQNSSSRVADSALGYSRASIVSQRRGSRQRLPDQFYVLYVSLIVH